MIPAPFVYNATVLDVVDGDSLWVMVDRGARDYSKREIRLDGCNARELHDVGGAEARDNLASMLPAGTAVTLWTTHPDKWRDRWLSRLHFLDLEGKEVDLSEVLVFTGWAARWDGRGEAPLPEWPRMG